MLPTYNERDNLDSIVAAVRAQLPLATVLVVDDGSPDGTGNVADLLAGGDPHVSVPHRAAKGGLWPAYVAGIDRALAAGSQIVVQMDADRSHDPAVLPDLVGAVRSGHDRAIGSRYVPGGGTPGLAAVASCRLPWGEPVRSGHLGAALPGHDLRLQSLEGGVSASP